MIKECPLLENEYFLESFPGIDNVASFFYSMMQVPDNIPYVFRDLGIKTVGGYLRKVNEGDPRAIEIYKKMKDTLGF